MVDEILRELQSMANPGALEGMRRFGINVENRLGLSVPQIRAIAKRNGRDQALAEELWDTGILDARILASFMGDPDVIRSSTMDRWARDFNCWTVCDACCCDLFDRTPYAWTKIRQWAQSNREFVRRAAFATIAGLAVHDKAAGDRQFIDALKLIEAYSFDDRNFVRKAINWALRNIGKRNARLLPHAIRSAERIRKQDSRAARWIAADALRELREYAYSHSPFYQRFHQGLTARPLQELPVLTKAMLMEHFDELVTDRAIRLEDVRHYLADPGRQERFLNRYRVMATSGSTGQPGVFLASQEERANLTVGFSRFPAWAGVPPTTNFAMVASTASGHMTSQIPAMVNGQLLPRLQVSASDPLEQLVRQLNEWQPGMVAGYPSILGVLAQEQQQGRLQITPHFIASGSEVLTDEMRQRIEQAWHTQLFNIYAAT